MTWRPVEELSKAEKDDFERRFAKKARFVVDESLGIGVARVLRDLKWNTTFASEVGLSGHSDEDVFAYAFRENRVLLTHDRDFLDDRRFPIHRNPGVIVFPGADGSGEPLVAALRSVIPVIGSYRKAFRRFKIYITEDGIWNITNMDRSEGLVRRMRLRFGRGGRIWEWNYDED
jgi:predicted nuclease of predicted toxin-antitoxin system